MRVTDIQQATAEWFGYPVEIMTWPTRGRPHHAEARRIAIFLTGRLTPLSTAEIGRQFGNRDRTSIAEAIRVIAHRRLVEPELAKDIADIMKELGLQAVAA